MANLGTILVDGAATNPTTDWAVGTFANIDEGISSADTSEVGDDTNATGDRFAYYRLSNVPVDFISMDTINYNIMYRVTGAQTNNRSLFIAIVTDEVTPTLLTTEATVATNITNTASNTTGAIGLTISGTPTEAQWNNALVRLRLAVTKNKGGDTNGIRVDTLEFTGTYTAVTVSPPTPVVRFDGIDWTQVLKINSIFTSSLAKIDDISLQPITGGGGSFTGILDNNPGSVLTGGVRRMTGDYTGNLMQIIRLSDNAVAEIGYDGNNGLDTASIESHCTGTEGYVLRLYGQSGNGRDIIGNGSGSSVLGLPYIYSGSAVCTLNGKPAIKITGGRYFSWTDLTHNVGDYMTGGASGDDKRSTGYMVGQQGATTSPYKITITDENEEVEVLWFYETSGAERIDFDETAGALGAAFTDDAQKCWVWQVEGSNFEAFENGSSIGSTSNASAQTPTSTGVVYNIGGLAFTSRNMNGYIQELAVWPTAVSQSGLYTDANAYYSFV